MKLNNLAWFAIPVLGLAGCKKGESLTIQAPGLSISSSGSHFNISGDASNLQTEVSGPTNSESRTVPAFRSIDADSCVQVKFVKGSASSVEVTARQSLLSHLKTKVQDGVLAISLEGNVQNPGPIVVAITNPELDQVTASGAAIIDCTGLSEPNLKVNADGASEVTLKGSVARLNIELNGSSHLEALSLGECQLQGSADGASKAELDGKITAADLDINGSSHIEVSGISGDRASFKSDGGSSVKCAGTVDDLTVQCGGSGDMDLKNLIAQTAHVTADGGSQVHVNVVKSLSANAGGGSSIRYSGKPGLTSSLDGGAQVSPE